MKAFRPERVRLMHELRATVRLALPLVFAQLAAIGSNVIDALLAGHFSAHVLGAVAVGASIWSLAIVSGIGMMMAGAAMGGAARRRRSAARSRCGVPSGACGWRSVWACCCGFAVRHAMPLIEL